MTIAILLIIAGFALLVAGGELLVRGASAIAQQLGVSPGLVGLTVVAAGTSMPELVVSVNAALSGNTDIAVGNVVGSNIFNIAVIVGLAALMAPLKIVGNTVRLEWPVMLLAGCLMFLLARDGSLDRLEGAFFVFSLVLFIVYTIKVARGAVVPEELEQLRELARPNTTAHTRLRSTLVTIVGCGLLIVGADCLISGAVEVAASWGVSQAIIGLTIVAAGTSLPELATSLIAAIKGQDDIAIANVLGSNIFNVFGILGTTALLHPIPVGQDLLYRDSLWMLGFSVLLFPLMKTGLRVTRAEGGILLAAFAAYLWTLLSA